MNEYESALAILDSVAHDGLRKFLTSYKQSAEILIVQRTRLALKQEISKVDRKLLEAFLGTEQYFIILDFVTEIRDILEGKLPNELQSNHCSRENKSTS